MNEKQLSSRLGMLTVAACIAGLPAIHLPAAPADSALEIMRESDRRQRVQSETYDGQIEVLEARGKVFRKSWKLWREGNGAQSKVIVRFNAPPEVEGVGLLILARPDQPDEQWMYTPAIRRDRRIAPRDRSARFMGTDFSHEDMEQRDVEEYDYDLLGEETRAGHGCWKIRARPRAADQSQYSWTDLWVRKDRYLVIRMEMYVRESLRKTLEIQEVAESQGIWSGRLLIMKDLERGSSTTLRRQNIRYNTPIEKDFFTLRSLRSP